MPITVMLVGIWIEIHDSTYESTSKNKERCESIKRQHDYALEGLHKACYDSNSREKHTSTTAESSVVDQGRTMARSIAIDEDSR